MLIDAACVVSKTFTMPPALNVVPIVAELLTVNALTVAFPEADSVVPTNAPLKVNPVNMPTDVIFPWAALETVDAVPSMLTPVSACTALPRFNVIAVVPT